MKKTILTVSCLTILMTVSATAGNWWEGIKVKGDLRYRHEMIDKEGKDARNRQRVRARVAIEGHVSEYTKAVVQIASGSDDPVSTNQTLGDAFSTKRIGLDLAYFESTLKTLPGIKVKGGKFKNPFFRSGKSELIWDSDWNPEGGAVTYSRTEQKITFTLTGAGLWIVERSAGKDSWLGAGQGVVRYNLPEHKGHIAGGAGYFNYVNTQGFVPFFDAEDSFGNTTTYNTDSLLVYANDYELVELFGEISHTFGDIPVTVAGDYVTNTAADSLNTGWQVGIKAGKTKKTGSWSLRYLYKKVEKDAVVGIFTDSDFRGGGTDAKGHELNGALKLAKNTTFKVSYFLNKVGLQKTETNFNRLQVDLQLKFK